MTEEQISSSPSESSSNDRLLAALIYVLTPFVPVFVLLVKEQSQKPGLKFHSVQSLIACAIFAILSAVTMGCGTVLFLVFFYWAYLAYQNQPVNIPLISDFVRKQGWA